MDVAPPFLKLLLLLFSSHSFVVAAVLLLFVVVAVAAVYLSQRARLCVQCTTLYDNVSYLVPSLPLFLPLTHSLYFESTENGLTTTKGGRYDGDDDDDEVRRVFFLSHPLCPFLPLVCRRVCVCVCAYSCVCVIIVKCRLSGVKYGAISYSLSCRFYSLHFFFAGCKSSSCCRFAPF